MEPKKLAHKKLIKFLTELELTSEEKTYNVDYIPSGPDDSSLDYIMNELDGRVPETGIRLIISGYLISEYKIEIEKLGENLLAEVKKNQDFLPADSFVEYFQKLKKDYSEIKKDIIELGEDDIDYLNPKLASEFEKRCEDKLVRKDLSNLFTFQYEFLRELIHSLIKIDENAIMGRIQKNGKGANKRLIWHGQVNQLVDIFYRLKNELMTKNGKYYLQDTNDSEIAEMIFNNFLQRGGETFSIDTIMTILKPSREDKRPNDDSKIDI